MRKTVTVVIPPQKVSSCSQCPLKEKTMDGNRCGYTDNYIVPDWTHSIDPSCPFLPENKT